MNFVLPDDSEMNCEELRLSSIRVAQNLSQLGVKEGDVVAMVCSSSKTVASILHGCILIGAPVNPLSPAFDKEIIRYMFELTEPKLIVCDCSVHEIVKEALDEIGNPSPIYTTHGETSTANDLLFPTGTESDFSPPKFTQQANEKLLAILCSSGTTGKPKGVQIFHSGCLKSIGMFPFMPPSVSLNFSPIYWGSGFFPQVFAPFAFKEVRIVTTRSFSIPLLVDLIRKYRVTSFTLLPFQLSLILNSNELEFIKRSSLTKFFSVGSILCESLRQQFKERLPGKSLGIVYSTTEVSIAMTRGNENVLESMSVGSMIFPNIVVKIADDDGVNVGQGEVGEIRVKLQFEFKVSGLKHLKELLRQEIIFQAYYKNSEMTKNAVDAKGFFKTGDIGFFNDSNALCVVDRKVDMMKYNGYSTNPAEIENIIQSIEGVQFVAVFGIPSGYSNNDLPTAVIVKCPGYDTLTEQIVSDFVAERFPQHKHLHGGVKFVALNEFPMTPTGKIQKQRLKKMMTGNL